MQEVEKKKPTKSVSLRRKPAVKKKEPDPIEKKAEEEGKVLVIGSSGFFGSWLCPGLEKLSHEIVPYDIEEGNDLHDTDKLLSAASGCSSVVMLAAIPHYSEKIIPPLFIRLNTLGTTGAIKALAGAGIRRFVFTSTGAIYGFGPGRDEGWVRPPITEDVSGMDWNVMDIYGVSKVLAENELRSWAEREKTFLSVVSLRVNCIEPHHGGAREHGAHHGWWCSQELAVRAYDAAIRRITPGFTEVNVGEENPKLKLTRLEVLLGDLL